MARLFAGAAQPRIPDVFQLIDGLGERESPEKACGA